MGQYYICVNLDKKEYLKPWDYDNGAKLMEHSYIGNNYIGTIESLLTSNNPWHKTRIVWAGDYMDDYVYLDEYIDTTNNADKTNLYNFAYKTFELIKPKSIGNKHIMRYIVNHSKRQYIDKSKIIFKYGQDLTIHPLPLLTCSGNGRGGGDYRSDINNEYVGIWAGDMISIELNKPGEYKELEVCFKE